MRLATALLALLLLTGASSAAPEREAERAEIAGVISNVIGWAKTKDLDLFYGSIANDEDYVSVTPGARDQALRGREAERPVLDEPRFQVRPA